jgi:hypothetical protein
VIRNPDEYCQPRDSVEGTFSVEATVSGYESLFEAVSRA